MEKSLLNADVSISSAIVMEFQEGCFGILKIRHPFHRLSTKIRNGDSAMGQNQAKGKIQLKANK